MAVGEAMGLIKELDLAGDLEKALPIKEGEEREFFVNPDLSPDSGWRERGQTFELHGIDPVLFAGADVIYDSDLVLRTFDPGLRRSENIALFPEEGQDAGLPFRQTPFLEDPLFPDRRQEARGNARPPDKEADLFPGEDFDLQGDAAAGLIKILPDDVDDRRLVAEGMIEVLQTLEVFPEL
jgi:hypothetical protein